MKAGFFEETGRVEPIDGIYASRAQFTFGETVVSATIAGLAVDTSRLA